MTGERAGRGVRAFALAVLLVLAAPLAGASTTASCEITPHGYIAAASTNGCSVTGQPTSQVYAQVTVVGGTVDEIAITMTSSTGERHDFVCTYDVSLSGCALPVRVGPVSGTWTVTARIVAADPLGPFLFGSADTDSRLDVTFT